MSGTDLEDIQRVRSLSVSEVDKLTKAQLSRALKAVIAAPNKEESSVEINQKLDQILNEIKDIRTERDCMKSGIDELKNENDSLREALMQHQRYLESIEAERRAGNVILTGVTEHDLIDGPNTPRDDVDKVKLILGKIGVTNLGIASVTRLGREATGNRPRPIKVQLQEPSTRKNILEKAKQLKPLGGDFAKIYIKKDIHPLVRKELNRLRAVEKQEKDKPENMGRTVQYDHKQRCVLVDGTIVDRFKPAFF